MEISKWLMLVQTERQAGEIRVKASSETLKDAEVILRSNKTIYRIISKPFDYCE
jgi:hypothetical protein